MKKYKMASDEGYKLLIQIIKDRMLELGYNNHKLANETGLSDSQVHRYLKMERVMRTTDQFMILGALNLRPYFIPAELDENEIQTIFFN